MDELATNTRVSVEAGLGTLAVGSKMIGQDGLVVDQQIRYNKVGESEL